jgi:hypothetical protein
VISPLLSNIYLHALDLAFADGAHGRLIRYADDFVVMCRSEAQARAAHKLARQVLAELGLELHREKTRVVDLREGREGLEFLGCHFHARVSGRLLERGICRYYLQRWPSQEAMKRVRRRIKALTGRGRAGMDIREVIMRINPLLRGWGNYFVPETPPPASTRSTGTSWDAFAACCASATAVTCVPSRQPSGRASGLRPTASTAYAAPSATRQQRRDHHEDHRQAVCG